MWSLIFSLSVICAVANAAPFDESLIGGHIMGGVNATIDEFPYQVSVHYNNFHTCGGVIIDRTTILTAAHCLAG